MKQALNILLLILTFVSCRNESNSELNKATSDKNLEVETSKYRQIIFGRYCGECYENCAPMFRLIMNKNKPTLTADFEDTYFNLESRLEFNTNIIQEEKLKIANEIVEKIPEALYKWKTDKERFGCPDCTDGCGYYLEFIKKNGDLKIFDLDDFEETENIPKKVLEFTHFLAKRIDKLTE
ncbi:hypothetical protein [Winogradskyella sp. SYSU M77433]|uniref:hypothetical protein n=1 Tax=Winogradskyella sp. SYSU M77433 TaxID=3042722 RepID=UPI0024814B53|nr:hypothetical protein [Winogradskyella sp. SYSU M77433]MDH7912318.1 hypothetical protein [Winogradskyella sp. SYSU M77433]